jgi:uncharacterized membrane protein
MVAAPYFADPPFDYSPGIVDFIMNRKFTKKGFIATMLRLEDKKAIELVSKGDRFYPEINAGSRAALSLSELVVLGFSKELSSKRKKKFTVDSLEAGLDGKYNSYWQKYRNAVIFEFHEKKFTNIGQVCYLDSLSNWALLKIYFAQFIFCLVINAALMLTVFLAGFLLPFLFTQFFLAEMLFFAFCWFYLLLNQMLIGYGNYSIIQWEAEAWFQMSLWFSSTDLSRVHRAKWQEFSRFVQDYSQISKQPLKYHELWGQFYTYALAVGEAKNPR